MKKLLLGALAALVPLAWTGSAHALGVFGLCVNKHKDACCYPQQNAFTPACCGVITIMTPVPAGTVDGAGHFGMFGHGKVGCAKEKEHKFKAFWHHKGEPASVRAAGRGWLGEPMDEGGYSMGDGYATEDGSYAEGESNYPMEEGSYAEGENNAPSYNVNPSVLGLGAGETLVGDVTVDGKVVSPYSLSRMMQPQAPALTPGANIVPVPAQQYVPVPAARPMLPATSMNMPYRANYPTIQQANYTPNQVPAQMGYYQPQNGYYQPQTGYYPYAVPQYGYQPYSQQQVPYYWNTLGGR